MFLLFGAIDCSKVHITIEPVYEVKVENYKQVPGWVANSILKVPNDMPSFEQEMSAQQATDSRLKSVQSYGVILNDLRDELFESCFSKHKEPSLEVIRSNINLGGGLAVQEIFYVLNGALSTSQISEIICKFMFPEIKVTLTRQDSRSLPVIMHSPCMTHYTNAKLIEYVRFRDEITKEAKKLAEDNTTETTVNQQ